MTDFANHVPNKKGLDPLEAVNFKGWQYGLYCAILGNEPSSVA